MESRRTPLLFALTLICLLGVWGCDTFGGTEGDGREENGGSPLREIWEGEYTGSGQEVDFFGELTNVSDIEPTLTIALRDTQSLQKLRLAWEDGNTFAQVSGEVNRLTPDTLVTPFKRVDADSFSTRFQFRLGRDTLSADSVGTGEDSIRVVGKMRQYYEDTQADSTIIEFTVAPK
jgi:hypothetical protein